jgi:hypothetical protein
MLGFLARCSHNHTNNLLSACCRGLFEEHKLLFSFLLCTSILRHPSSGLITEAEWSFLTRGAPSAAAAAGGGPQPPAWLPDGAWGKLKALEVAVPLFKGITESLQKHEAGWKAWWVPFRQPHPHMLCAPYQQPTTTCGHTAAANLLTSRRSATHCTCHQDCTCECKGCRLIPLLWLHPQV